MMLLLFLGANVLTLAPDHKLPIQLSSTDMNRLALTNGRIAQLFGSDVFHIEMDDKNGQVFLRLKEEEKEQFLGPHHTSLALVTEDGTTQELQVSFYEGDAKPCLFRLPPEKRLSNRRQAMHFFHTVLSGKCDDYVVQTIGDPIKREGLQIVFQKKVVSPLFEASFYQVRSDSRKRWQLNHQHFKEPGICGIYLSTTHIDACKQATLVIMKRRI